MINKELKKYVEENIFPVYSKNDLGHNIEHINYVINRSLKFANNISNINYDMVYLIAAYHDIGHHIDAKNHEKISSEMLLADENLKRFFNEEEIKLMVEAVYDHRASLEYEPRSIYGKIVSSADRNTSIDIPLKRTYSYRVDKNPNASLEQIMEESRQHLIEKFGKKGYATEKMYFDDPEYKQFLEEIALLAEDKERFRDRYIRVNKLESKIIKEQLEKYNPVNEQEEIDKQTMLNFINTFSDVLTRENVYGHFSASAFVVNENLNKTLLVHHNILGGFVSPGGHADGEYDLLSVAIREVIEETGLDVVPLNNNIFAIQSGCVKGHVKNGKYVSAHTHYDILYLLVAKNADMDKIRILEDENSKVEWRDLDHSYGEDIVDWARPINEKIVKKIRSLKK